MKSRLNRPKSLGKLQPLIKEYKSTENFEKLVVKSEKKSLNEPQKLRQKFHSLYQLPSSNSQNKIDKETTYTTYETEKVNLLRKSSEALLIKSIKLPPSNNSDNIDIKVSRLQQRKERIALIIQKQTEQRNRSIYKMQNNDHSQLSQQNFQSNHRNQKNIQLISVSLPNFRQTANHTHNDWGFDNGNKQFLNPYNDNASTSVRSKIHSRQSNSRQSSQSRQEFFSLNQK